MEKAVVLVTSRTIADKMNEERTTLEGLAEVYHTMQLSDNELKSVLPRVQVLFISEWPGFLTSPKEFEQMKKLELIQCLLAGVDHIPFGKIPKHVTVCSNAGGFTEAVAEHAWALALEGCKRLCMQYEKLRRGEVSTGYQVGIGRQMMLLDGKIFGVIGLGPIGRHAAKIAKAFAMKVYAITRSGTTDFPCDFVGDPKALPQVLTSSDILLLSVALTKKTRGLLGRKQLDVMKDEAVLVNIARGELIDEQALFKHLKSHPNFIYATDVFWRGSDGRELLKPSFPFFKLPNFFATPHTSGPLGFVKGRALRHAIENIERYLKGEPAANVIRREDYLAKA